MNRVAVPVWQWEEFAKSNSCLNAVEQKGSKPVSVRTFKYNGFMYTSFGVSYGCYSRSKLKPTICAYKLLPESLYAGTTITTYHNDEAIKNGLRERGDLTGLIVSVGGRLAVCAEKVDFLCELPNTTPISMAEAQSFNDSIKDGWRVHWFEEVACSWFTLDGHPVALYKSEDRENHAVLFWRKKGSIQEMSIANDVELSPVIAAGDGLASNSPCTDQHGQLGLF